MISSDILRRLAALRLDPDQMREVLDIVAESTAAVEAVRAAGRERVRAFRERKAGNVTVTVTKTLPVTLQESKKPPQRSRSAAKELAIANDIFDFGGAENVTLQSDVAKKDPIYNSLSFKKDSIDEERKTEVPNSAVKDRAAQLATEFMQFWKLYPHKVDKPAAMRAFRKARLKFELEPMLAGVDRYIRDKPVDRSYCNPATWLNGERWNDRPMETANGRSVLAAGSRLLNQLGGAAAAAAYVPGSSGPKPLSLDHRNGQPAPKLVSSR